MIKRLWFQFGAGGAGGGGVQGNFGPTGAAEPFKPGPCLRQKLFISPPFLRRDTLFHDPDSFRFAQEIMFIKLT